jgi:RNA recognition motif-containing protein
VILVAKTLYVGNLPWESSEEELEKLFAEMAVVESVRIIRDRETGRSKGFGFVELADGTNLEEIIASTNGMLMGGRTLVVNEAKPR